MDNDFADAEEKSSPVGGKHNGRRGEATAFSNDQENVKYLRVRLFSECKLLHFFKIQCIVISLMSFSPKGYFPLKLDYSFAYFYGRPVSLTAPHPPPEPPILFSQLFGVISSQEETSFLQKQTASN